MAEQLTEHDVIKAHARDELGIDVDDLSNPLRVRRGQRQGAHLGMWGRQLVGQWVTPLQPAAGEALPVSGMAEGASGSNYTHYKGAHPPREP